MKLLFQTIGWIAVIGAILYVAVILTLPVHP